MGGTEADKEIADAMASFQAYAAFGPGILSDAIRASKASPVDEKSAKLAAEKKEEKAEEIILPPEPKLKAKTGLDREQCLDLLNMIDGNKPIAREIAKLAHKLVSGDPKIKLDFLSAHAKIKELELPKDPFEVYNLSEARFQETLMKFQYDEEIMQLAEKVLPQMHAPPQGEAMSRKDLSLHDVLAVHEMMIQTLSSVLEEFRNLPRDKRHSFSPKMCETTAELLVSIAVEKKFGCVSDDVERALIEYEQELQQRTEFAQASHVLTGIMQQLVGCGAPRFSKEEFTEYLGDIANQSQTVKKFVGQLYDMMKKGTKTMLEAYKEFSDFTDKSSEQSLKSENLSPQELREHYDTYGENDEEIQKRWEASGCEVQTIMQLAALTTTGAPPTGLPPAPKLPSPSANKKVQKLKASDAIDMQELMVDELKKYADKFSQAVQEANGTVQFRDQVAIGLVQALASLAVEKRYHICAEEMAVAGFMHAQVLSTNERFIRSTMTQQQILMGIPQLVQDPGRECSIM